MKITAQEEYGLRLLIRIAGCKTADGLSIPQLSEAEGLGSHYVAKLTRNLRMAGFINSTPGNKGGYVLAMPAREIVINKVLKALGGPMFDEQFCGTHAGALKLCTNSVSGDSRDARPSFCKPFSAGGPSVFTFPEFQVRIAMFPHSR